MSFTPVASWDHAQDRTRANEIVRAYSERRQALGQSAVTALASNDNAQDTAFWRGMQEWVDTYCTSFVNDGATIAGATAVPMHTLTSFRTEAGISSGWRRATAWSPPTDPTWSYGTIQSADIRGPWIFEDLQKAFDALRWTTKAVNFGSGSGQGEGSGTIDESECATKRSEYISNWDTYYPDGLPYTDAGTTYYPGSAGAYYGVPSGGNVELQWRTGKYETASVSSIPTHIDHAASLYAYTQKRYRSPTAADYYIDMLGLGAGQDERVHVRNYTSANAATRDCAAMPGEILSSPFVVGSVTCGSTPGWYGGTIYGDLILKWDFTDTL